MGPDDELKLAVFHWLHSSAQGGHSGKDVTVKRVKALFYWKRLGLYVSQFVQNCLVFQANKHNNAAYPGLLQPLSVPKEVWVDISMDFISGMPISQGKDVIWVVVDRLSKSAHFMALCHPYTAAKVAQCYLDRSLNCMSGLDPL